MQLPKAAISTYADDTAIIFSADTWEDVKTVTENGLYLVANWLKQNILTLNVSKTKVIPFSITAKTKPGPNYQIKIHSCEQYPNKISCDCPNLDLTDSIKYLGVNLDKHLRWDLHIDIQTSRVRKLIYIFKSLRHVADPELVRKVYIALVQPLITYCLPVWGGAPKTHCINIERAQRSVLKVMSFKPYRYPTNALYNECNLLTVRQLFILHILMFQHSKVDYTAVKDAMCHKRVKHNVCTLPNRRSKFFERQTDFLAAYLYNKINKELNIFDMTRYKLKLTVQNWLYKKDYNQTEDLLQILS